MKKSIITLAVLASMGAHAGNTTLSGSAKATLGFEDKGETSTSDSIPKFKLNSSSSFAVSGEEKLVNGLSALYNIGVDVNDKVGAGDVFVGLKSDDFGNLTIGKQGLGGGVSNNSDPFEELSPGGAQDIDGDTTNHVVYTTPNFDGFSLTAGAGMDGKVVTDKNGKKKDTVLDIYKVQAQYDANGIFAGLSFAHSLKELAEVNSVISAGVGYANDDFSVGLTADLYSKDDKFKPLWGRLGAKYNITADDSVYAGGSVYYVGKDKSKSSELNIEASLGYSHNFSERTKTFIEYGYKRPSGDKSKFNNNVKVGLKTSF